MQESLARAMHRWHSRMIIRHANGILEGGADPRSDGAVAAY
jgi:hypothetical protein